MMVQIFMLLSYFIGTFAIWEQATLKRKAQMESHDGAIINNMTVVGKQLWSCGHDKNVLIWDTRSSRYNLGKFLPN